MRFIASNPLLLIASITYKVRAAPTVDQNPCDYNYGDECPGVALFEWQCCDNGAWYACEPGDGRVLIFDFFNTGLNCVGGFFIHCDDLNEGCELGQALPFQ
jgi:hypothetical protein